MVQSASTDALTHPELLARLDRLKAITWALPAVPGHHGAHRSARSHLPRTRSDHLQFLRRPVGLGRSPDPELIKATLGRITLGLRPDELEQAADRLALLIDQDRDEPDDADHDGNASSPSAASSVTG